MSLSLREKQSLYHSLAQLVRTGIPFPAALDKLVHTTCGDQRQLVEAARKSLAAGRTVAEAFSKQSSAATPLEIAVIGAVEKSGQLERGLSELSEYFGALNQARLTIIKQSAYPIFVLHFGIFALGSITLVLKDAAHFWHEVGTSLFFIYGGALIIALLVPLLRDAGASSASTDRILITIPLLGQIRRSFALSRFSTVYGLQLDAGVNIIDALLTAGRTSRSGLVQTATDAAAQQVRGGAQVGPLLAASGAFPGDFTQAVIVGEETGALDDELRRMAKEYREKALSALEAFADWLPKLLYVGIVVFLAFKIVAILHTIYAPVEELLKN